MQFSLDQRLYNMKITKRKLCNECANRGRMKNSKKKKELSL